MTTLVFACGGALLLWPGLLLHVAPPDTETTVATTASVSDDALVSAMSAEAPDALKTSVGPDTPTEPGAPVPATNSDASLSADPVGSPTASPAASPATGPVTSPAASSDESFATSPEASPATDAADPVLVEALLDEKGALGTRVAKLEDEAIALRDERSSLERRVAALSSATGGDAGVDRGALEASREPPGAATTSLGIGVPETSAATPGDARPDAVPLDTSPLDAAPPDAAPPDAAPMADVRTSDPYLPRAASPDAAPSDAAASAVSPFEIESAGAVTASGAASAAPAGAGRRPGGVEPVGAATGAAAAARIGPPAEPLERLVIDAVPSGGPAEIAGLVPGDVLLAVDGQPLDEFADILVHDDGSDAQLHRLEIMRDGRRLVIPFADTPTALALRIDRIDAASGG